MSRSRYEHGFERDLFISYSHHDNQEPEKWVEAFEERLHKRLDEITGKDIRIWRDARILGPGALLDPAVMSAVESSAIFLMVLSPNWASSDWCPREHTQFRSNGPLAVGNRSRIVAVEKYPVKDYPEGVQDTFISRFFLLRKPDNIPEYLVVNKIETRRNIFEDLLTTLAWNLDQTLQEMARNPIQRLRTQEGSVWFAPPQSPATLEMQAALAAQVRQCGFEVTEERERAKLEVVLVGSGEPRDESYRPERPQLVYVGPSAQSDGLGQQMVRELAGRNGLEVLTDWSEFQERLTFRLKQSEPRAAAVQGTRVYLMHEDVDGKRADELTAHLSEAGCIVQPQMAATTKARATENKHWMEQSEAILLLFGRCSADWAAIQLRHLDQYGRRAKHRCLFLDDPDSNIKKILKRRPDLHVMDGIGGGAGRPLIRRFLEGLR